MVVNWVKCLCFGAIGALLCANSAVAQNPGPSSPPPDSGVEGDLFSQEQRAEIERIVEETIISRMGGGSGGYTSDATPAPVAGLVDARNPQALADIASAFGPAETDKDSLGDPMVRGQMEGVHYAIYFYGCENGGACRNLQFRATWDYKGATEADVTRWNREKRFGKAYLDAEGNLTIDMDVNVDFGVSPENMNDTVDWWKVVLNEFVTFFNL